MKFTPFQLAVIGVVTFGSIVLLNVLAQYRSNADFKEFLEEMKPSDLIPLRNKRVAEENMQSVPAAEFVEAVSEDDDE